MHMQMSRSSRTLGMRQSFTTSAWEPEVTREGIALQAHSYCRAIPSRVASGSPNEWELSSHRHRCISSSVAIYLKQEEKYASTICSSNRFFALDVDYHPLLYCAACRKRRLVPRSFSSKTF